MKNKKIKTWHKIFLIVLVLTFVGLKFWQFHWPEINLELKGKKIHVLLADTFAHQYKGLGDRKNLGKYDGMLFVFSEKSKIDVVMRDMKFPIDIIWLDDGEIVDMALNVPVEKNSSEKQLIRYYPRKPVNLFLELPAGWIEKNDVKIGDRISLVDG